VAQDADDPAVSLRRTLIPLGLVIVLAGLSVGMAVLGFRHDRTKAATAQREAAAQAATALTAAVGASRQRIEDLAGLFAASRRVSPAEFEAFARPLLDMPAVGISYNTRIRRAERAGYERSRGRALLEIGPGGRLRPAPERPYYDVIVRSVNPPGARTRLGVHVGSDPVRRETIARATETGRAQSSAPVVVLSTGRPGVLIFAPVLEPGAPRRTAAERERSVRGFAVGVYSTEELAGIVQGLLPRRTAFELRIDGRRVARFGASAAKGTERRVEVAGRTWVLTVDRPPLAGLGLGWAAVILGATLTLLVALILLQALRRERYALALVERHLAERDRSEAARRTAEERFRRAFDHSPIGMALMDPSGRYVQVNDALCAITGYDRDRLEGARFAAITHPDDVAGDYEYLHDLLAGRVASYSREKRYLHASGDEIWVSLHAAALREADGSAELVLTQVQDIAERRDLQRRLEHLADHEPLTGLLNRRGFERRLARHLALGRGPDARGAGALVVLDVDHFKAVNDTLGHHAGDRLLVGVARILESQLRGGDLIARLGGDEFAVLLAGADAAAATAVSAKLVRAIRERAFAGEGAARWTVTVSAGAAVIGERPRDAAAALAAADEAMYAAKQAGRDGFELSVTPPAAAAPTFAR